MFKIELSGAGYQEIPLFYPFNGQVVRYMTQASDKNFWGVFGANILNFTQNGQLLQQIPVGSTSGSQPAMLMQASNGTIVGLTNSGGFDSGDAGQIFTMEPSLAPPKPFFVGFSPSSGRVGSKVMIHGVHFIGSTRVTFNGVSANFEVLNTGNIQAAVPADAGTGPIVVTNTAGSAASQQSFIVE